MAASDASSVDPAPRSGFCAAPSPVRSSLDIAIPVVTLATIVCLCFGVPALTPLPSPVGGDVLEANAPLFSAPQHWLGTDMNGNDILSRLLHGGQASLAIALSVNLIGLVLGGVIGAASGYAGRFADALIMRVLDVFIAFPSLVLVLAVAQGLDGGILNAIWSLSFFSVPAFARVARAATLRIRDQAFVASAVLSGAGLCRIVFRHIAPNIAPQLITFGLLGMGVVMVIEGGLSFLGFGLQEPSPSWGNMIAQGQQSLLVRPSLVLLPSSLLFLTILSCNLLGEALRARWNTR
jgi:peptide/nickel transport system permease protein